MNYENEQTKELYLLVDKYIKENRILFSETPEKLHRYLQNSTSLCFIIDVKNSRTLTSFSAKSVGYNVPITDNNNNNKYNDFISRKQISIPCVKFLKTGYSETHLYCKDGYHFTFENVVRNNLIPLNYLEKQMESLTKELCILSHDYSKLIATATLEFSKFSTVKNIIKDYPEVKSFFPTEESIRRRNLPVARISDTVIEAIYEVTSDSVIDII